jgi:hypothetical protein
MSKAGAFLTLVGLAGLLVAYALPWGGLVDERDGFTAQLDVVKTPAPREPIRTDVSVGMAPEGWRTFTGGAASAAGYRASAAPVVVRAEPRGTQPTRVQAATPLSYDRISLTRELQRELKRVGCYQGEISGAWSQPTRNAMRAFTERINASLPVEEPDAVLLALVQGHQDRACGMPCPVGQGLAADGRCLPNAILAHGKKPPPALASAAQRTTATADRAPGAATISGWATTTTTTPVPLPEPGPAPEGRMALSGPTGDQARAAPEAARVGPPATVAGPRYDPLPPRGSFAASLFRRIDRAGTY